MIQEQAIKESVLLSPQAMTNGATLTANHDTIGGDYSTIRVLVNCAATNTIASANGASFSVATSDVTNATTFVAFGTTQTGVKNSCELIFHSDARYRGRYIQLTATTGTNGVTNENITVAAVGTLTRLEQLPNSAAAEVSGANDAVQIN